MTTAVKAGRADVLAELLAAGADPNEPKHLPSVDGAVLSSGMPLYYCASHGDLGMAQLLVDAGADPNAAVYAAGSAMHRAYWAGDAAMIELLERYGGAVDGITIGMLGLEDRARRMLDENPNAVSDLLWGAAGAGHSAIVRLCLERIDWPRDDSRWYNMLREPVYIGVEATKAERRAKHECFRLLLARADASVRFPSPRGPAWGRTLLHDLAPQRHEMPSEDRVAIATMLLDAGARLDLRDDLLMSTPLGWACRWGRVELVQLLLRRGADPIEADAEPWATPLAWARRYGRDEIVRMVARAVVVIPSEARDLIRLQDLDRSADEILSAFGLRMT